MEICAINGSLRGGRGAFGRIISVINKGFACSGKSITVINLADMRIEDCKACNLCQTTKTYKCIYDNKDDVAAIFQTIRESDIVIYATPIYVFGISSLLKKLFERMYSAAPVDDLTITKSNLLFHSIDTLLMSKPLISIVVSDNIENRTVSNAKGYFENYCKFTNSIHIAHLERRSASTWLHSLEEDKNSKKAQQILEAYEQIGEELATNGTINRKTVTRTKTKMISIPSAIKIMWKIPQARQKIQQEMDKRSKKSIGK